MKKEHILITGAKGQIGSVLTTTLRKRHGQEAVLATDIRHDPSDEGPFEVLDALDGDTLHELVRRYKITQIYHLAAILSAKGEQNPLRSWDINMRSLFNVLEVSRQEGVQLFFPSSIAVFGPNTPRLNTPQETVMQPGTVYGISKVAGENWCQYYFDRHGLDVRSIRYPGLISYQSLPGGGTTDYAVDIYHHAVKGESFSCFLQADTRLPMLYMEDAIRGTVELMESDAAQIRVRSSYNLSGMSFTPAELAAEIRKHVPQFEITYAPDFRQKIADSWSDTIDDSVAREHWGWQAQYDIAAMTEDMLKQLAKQYGVSAPL